MKGKEGIDWKKCLNPSCKKIIRKTRFLDRYRFNNKKYCDATCRDDFKRKLDKEVRIRLKKSRFRIQNNILKEWGIKEYVTEMR